jgi:transposase InsO family protein
LKRHESEGVAGLADRSSRPHRLYRPTPQAIVERIETLRRQRLIGKAIAAEVGVSPATVSRVLRRLGLNKLSVLELEPVRRYERENPGELIHIDIKKLGRIGSVGHRITGRRTGVVNRHLGIGWEFVHVCIDDASRIAFSRVMKDERKESAAIAYYASLGVKIERVMTDNGSCYRSKAFGRACKRLGLKHIFTKPYTPRLTVRPNASSRRACANGPMLVPTTRQTNEPLNCRDGFIATIGIAPMAVSDQSHPSADSA